MQDRTEEFLKIYVGKYPHRPDHAFFRAEEACRLCKYPLVAPVLDLACGDGSFGAALLPPGSVGADLNPSELEKAKTIGTYASLAAADAEALPFRDCSFRTIFSNCALEHMRDVGRVVSEVARILEPGGAFVFTVSTKTFSDILFPYMFMKRIGLRGAAEQYLCRVRERMSIQNLLGKEEWIDLLNRNGFDIVESVAYLQGASGMFWSILFHAMSARAPVPGFWKRDGVSYLLRAVFRRLPRTWPERLVCSMLRKRILKEAAPEAPSAGVLFYSVRN